MVQRSQRLRMPPERRRRMRAVTATLYRGVTAVMAAVFLCDHPRVMCLRDLPLSWRLM